jgi:competence protein ComEA
MTTSRRIWSSVLAVAVGLVTAAASGSVHIATAKGATETNAVAAAEQAGHGDKININTADVKELMKLAGVHKKTAEKIVEYRQAHGGFHSIDELNQVEGIGDKRFAALKESVQP